PDDGDLSPGAGADGHPRGAAPEIRRSGPVRRRGQGMSAATAAAPGAVGLGALAPRLVAESAEGARIAIDADSVTIAAPAASNLFCDPRTGRCVATAPRLLAPLPGDGWLRAQ